MAADCGNDHCLIVAKFRERKRGLNMQVTTQVKNEIVFFS
jgi:hypothetical protein